MAEKYGTILRLAQETEKRIIANDEEWISFLASAGRFSKYPFEEQMLIHAQRPGASACAPVRVWDSLGCWINRGVKGIALIDTDAPRPKLKYVFDVADVTPEKKRNGRLPYLWSVKPEYKQAVIGALETVYGKTDAQYPFEDRIAEMLIKAAEGCYEDVARKIAPLTKGSLLEGMEERRLAVTVFDMMATSALCAVINACGVEHGKGGYSFPYMRNFNTTETLHAIGDAIGNLVRPMVAEIGRAVRACELQAQKEAVEKSLAKRTEKDYNALKRESAGHEADVENGKEERGAGYGTDIQTGRELSDTGHRDGQTAGRGTEEVRPDEEEILKRTQGGAVLNTPVQKRADGAPVHTPGAGRGTDGADRGTDGQGRRGGRGAQSRQSDVVGSENEQHQALGRGDHPVGNDILLNLTNSESEEAESQPAKTQSNSKAEMPGSSALPGISVPEIVSGILLHDAEMLHSRAEIAGFFLAEPDAVKRMKYVRESYRMEIHAEFEACGENAGYIAKNGGLTMWRGKYINRVEQTQAPWGAVSSMIADLIEKGRYLLPGEEPVKPAPKETYEQMSLFPDMGGSSWDAAAGMGTRQFQPAVFHIQEGQIDSILRTGGGRNGSRMRIYARYQQGKTPEEMAAFLAEEYGQTGKGFMFDGQKVSVWFDRDGMKVCQGMSAKGSGMKAFTWGEAEQRIRSMVENGAYMNAGEIFLVDEFERNRVARGLLYFFRDGIEEMPQGIGLESADFQASQERLAEALSTKEGTDAVAEFLDSARIRIESGEKKLKWRSVMRPEELLAELDGLRSEKRKYPEQAGLPDLLHEDFITQDEIDMELRSGGIVEGGKFRIYEHFMEKHSRQESIGFLKGEYGMGGRSSALPGCDASGSWHDAKGIRLTKGSIVEPYIDTLLKWNVVEERIRFLVSSGQYLTPDSMEAYEKYKKKQAEEKLHRKQAGQTTAHRREDEKAQDTDAQGMPAEDSSPKMAGSIPEAPGRWNIDHGSPDYYKYFYDAQQAQEYQEKTGYKQFWASDSQGMNGDTYVVYRSIHDLPPFLRGYAAQQEERREREQQKEAVRQEREQQRDEGRQENGTSEAVTGDAQAEKTEETEAQAGKAETQPGTARMGAVNFRIKFNMDEGKGFAPKEKFRQNVEAIRALEMIEGENRAATLQEQEILSRYAGWGGLADAFDENKDGWAAEYRELKGLLSPEEYSSARASTLTAFYTSPLIIQCIYEAAGRMGFTAGNILDPSAGIGNFFGMLPESMQGSRLYGTEIDSLTGRIARHLYPKADIKVMGFEKTDYPNDFFDLAVGNVPFGQFKAADREYDRHNFLIHDYFFVKTLDKLRPGGIMALITSKGTLDKKDESARKRLAQKAELLGAVRLPNTAFKDNAGTDITSDILFFKKLDRAALEEPGWVHLGKNAEGIEMNRYFVEHPNMVLGRMEMVSGAHGMEAVCLPDTAVSLQEQLRAALSCIEGSMEPSVMAEMEDADMEESIPADPNIKNYSYTMVGEKVYYRENSIMKPVDASETVVQRIKGMVQIRDCTQDLINLQLDEYPESVIKERQADLNRLYDMFSEKYGRINTIANRRAFSQDSGYCLLCSLEKLDAEGNFTGKADMFTKRTIKRHEAVTSVATGSEALAVSLSEKAAVDMDYMSSLTGKSIEDVAGELAGVIFQNPITGKWETADEYLSGNVREKLAAAQTFAESRPEYAVNVTFLKKAQPKELDASEIEVRIGATWVRPEYIEDFVREVFQTPEYLLKKKKISVRFSSVSGQWGVNGKNADTGNTLINSTYGTDRANAYRILEDSLNLRDTCIYDNVTDDDGREKRVLNKNETMLAGQKQEAIREAFKDWVFRDRERREDLCRTYNELFNSTRPREYDGSHLKFPGMTQDITLKPHQLSAVAHQLYGKNTLLAHCVGAGKTFEMAAAAMECKRLGLCSKSLFVVPNHLTEQWAADFLRLYPGANVLAATKKDFEPANRKKFCSRIATGGYDAVIIGHTQFEKIPLSRERQADMIERQIDEIEMAIRAVKEANGERYTIKQMEKTKKSLAARLERLNDASRKDDVVTFEQLGVDRLFVDESHNYKNLFLFTKMRNVAGIAQSEAQKSSDMLAKCQYMDELTGGTGITFATGTPISNSMAELYTNMRYLQHSTLQRLGLGHFDAWASSFGETVTAVELAPEGSGYRAKTRFAKFFNLPELMSIFKECADIQTADMLKLPVPEVKYENVVLKPSEYQTDMVQSLAERAEKVRNQEVDPERDNMLKITNDGRKLALDQRIINPLLPDDGNSKANACADNVYRIWKEHSVTKAAQLIFSDLSTPTGKKTIEMKESGDGAYEMDAGQFGFENVYDDLRRKLIQRGIPAGEIRFIHEASTDVQKKELFAKVRSGEVRVLLGSTQKMGAGTNVQDRLIALHHLDVPWRPADIEQREGRIIRQGNQNPSVMVFRYITENTFDSYSWQIIENKQKFIGQIMTSKSPVRSCEDIDEAALTFAEVKALATGNPLIREKMDLDMQVSKLKLIKANHASQQYRLEDDIAKKYPQQIASLKERISGFTADIGMYRENKPDGGRFSMTVAGRVFTEKREAGAALLETFHNAVQAGGSVVAGEYLGFQMRVEYDSFFFMYTLTLKGCADHTVEMGKDPLGNLYRINNVLEDMGERLAGMEQKLANVERQFETAKEEIKKPFAQERELAEKLGRLNELNALLNMDMKEETGRADDVSECQGQDAAGRDAGKRPSVLMKLKEKQKIVSMRDAGNAGREGMKRETGMTL